MDVTLSGMVIDVRLLHPLKALFPIDVTLSGMITDTIFILFSRLRTSEALIDLTPSVKIKRPFSNSMMLVCLDWMLTV
jgi:hypothetical protein